MLRWPRLSSRFATRYVPLGFAAAAIALVVSATPHAQAASLISPAASAKPAPSLITEVRHGGGAVFRGGGFRAAPAFRGAGVRHFPGGAYRFGAPVMARHHYAPYRPYWRSRHHFRPRYYGYAGPRYYGYVPYYYGPRRFCRVVWTYYGPRKICRYKPWRHHWRHHHRRHHWRVYY